MITYTDLDNYNPELKYCPLIVMFLTAPHGVGRHYAILQILNYFAMNVCNSKIAFFQFHNFFCRWYIRTVSESCLHN